MLASAATGLNPLNLKLSTPPRILIVRLSALGDIIHTLPVLATLRNSYPDATIGWMVESGTGAEALLADHPQLDHVHVINRKQWFKNALKPWRWGAIKNDMVEQLSAIDAVDYDVVVDTQGLFKSAVSAWLTGIEQRVGFEGAREKASMFYTHLVKRDYDEKDPDHTVTEAYFKLTDALGCIEHAWEYRLPPSSVDTLTDIGEVFDLLDDPHQAFIMICPGTRWESKQWPVSYWQETINQLLNQSRANLAFVGTEADRALTADILEGIDPSFISRCLNLTGQTDLLELKALMEQADIVIGGDSFAAHLAGAIGHHGRLHDPNYPDYVIPYTIGIYGPTSPRRTPPPGQNYFLITTTESLSCMPCHKKTCPLRHHECMTTLTPDMVVMSVFARLGKRVTLPFAPVNSSK